MIEFKELKKILELVKENGIVEFELQEGEFRLSTKLSHPASAMTLSAPAPAAAPLMSSPSPAPEASAPAVAKPSIKSPMVGSFYRSPSPDAEPFVKVGDVVTPESTVCIIEAMKVMNEIKADLKGRITRLLIENGEAVEFGQPLFEVEPL